MKVLAFNCIKPTPDKVSMIASLPYDVYNRTEAREIVKANPLSYLSIERPDSNFEDTVGSYEDVVYQKSNEILNDFIKKGFLVEDLVAKYYVYVEVFRGRTQKGIVGKCSLEEYLQGDIKKHELTREDKERDRVRNIQATNAQTGPIFLAFKHNDELETIIEATCNTKPIYDFVSIDDVRQIVYEVPFEFNDSIQSAFENMSALYVADGHHRIKAASSVYEMKKNSDTDLSDEAGYVLAVLFPENELEIMDYNRVVKDLNGYSEEDLLCELQKFGQLTKVDKCYKPEYKGCIGIYLGESWYKYELNIPLGLNAVEILDCSLLQNIILAPILNIDNPRTNPRIDFIGGIRGLEEIELRCHRDMKIGFSMYPTQMTELFAVADNDLLMPPKSTWFEPKLQSGLFTRRIG